jgi:hypothetical protein
MTKQLKTKVKDWYLKEHPSDELGKDLKENLTFEDLREALNNGQEIYEVLGAFDSIIREYCFAELAKRLNVEYNRVYTLWLFHEESTQL